MSKKKKSQQDISKAPDTTSDLHAAYELIAQKDMEIERLKNKTEKNKLIISDEEIIAEIQLQTLKMKAQERELTLEEVKKYDLLVKNKRLAQGNPTLVADYSKLPDSTSKPDLLRIASYKTANDSSDE